MNVVQLTGSGTTLTANFPSATVLDGDYDNVKVSFYCYVGDNTKNYYLQSNNTTPIIFYSQDMFTLF
jgi:hypothetical protein